MGISLLPSMLWGTLLCLMLHWSRRLAPVGADEESAHALALARRRKLSLATLPERRCAIDRRATASVLGSGETAIDCRIVKVSSAGMSIAVPLAVPLGEQINVAWENEFFVGAVSYAASQDGGHVLDLQLIASNISHSQE